MKTFVKLILLMLLLPLIEGCVHTYEIKDVYMSIPDEMECFLSEFGISSHYDYSVFGDITYEAKKELPLGIIYDENDEEVPYLDVRDLKNKSTYVITSNKDGGFRLSVKTTQVGEEYRYDSIKLICPLYPSFTSHDSVIGEDLLFVGRAYGMEQSNYASRPCSGKISVYRVDGDESYLSKETVEASDEQTAWREYYANGIIKSETVISSNPNEFDEDGLFSACPFIEKTKYYFEDGVPKTIENVIYRQHGNYALFACDYNRGDKPIWAVFLKDEQMIVFVSSKNIHTQLAPELRYNYEIQDNKLRFYNGWERYAIARVKHYPETKAEIFLENDDVYFKNMKQYGNINIHMSATLTRDYLPAQLLEFVRKYAHTTLRGE